MGIYPNFVLDGLHYSWSTLIYANNDLDASYLTLLTPLLSKKSISSNDKPSLYRATPLKEIIHFKIIQNLLKIYWVSPKINPLFVTGFSNAEGYFLVNVFKNPKLVNGYRVYLGFNIGLHIRDLDLLVLIKEFFNGLGSITKLGNESVQYRVSSIEDLKVIIAHFDSFPLITPKKADYLLFKPIFFLVCAKEHLTLEGLKKIMSIRSSINLGLSEGLANLFSIIPVKRPIIINQQIKDPYWLTGFVCGDGCFMVSISKSKSTKTGYAVRLFFSISQDKRDTLLMKYLANYLSCGD